MSKKTYLLPILLIVFAFVFTACGKASEEQSATETAQAVLVQVATEMQETLEAEPTTTPTNAPTAIPTSTPRPTEIPPTPTLDLPVSVQTSVPSSDVVLETSNVDQIQELALYGAGTFEEIAVSPSGRWVAAATISGLSLYQTGSTSAVETYLANQSVRSVAFSANGEMVAAGLQSGGVVVLAVGDGSIVLNEMAHEGPVYAVAFSPDGLYLASGGADGIVILWDASTFTVTKEIEAHGERVNDLAFSPDSLSLASASSDFYTRIWTVSGELVDEYLLQNGGITAVAFSNSGMFLATGSTDYTVYLWSLVDEDFIPALLENDNIVRTIAFAPDDSQIAVGGDDYGVDIWELFADDGTYLGILSQTLNHDYTVKSVAYLPDGDTLVSATWGSLLSWWNVPDRETTQLIDRGFLISAGIFDGTPIILAEPAIGTLLVYNGETGEGLQFIEEAHNTSIYQAALSPNQQWVVTGSYDGFRIWDFATGDMLYEGTGYTGFISALKWSAGSELLAIGFNNGDVVLFTPETLTEETFDVSNARILAIDFSPDLNVIATGGDDNDITLWRRTDGDEIATLEGHIDTIYGVAFSPDGSLIASASSDYSINIWQGITGEPEEYGKFITSFEDHTFRVKGVAFSPDGRLIASIADDGTAMLWGADNGEQLAVFEGFTGYAKAIEFTTDGTLFYAYDWDGVMRIFGIPVK